MMGKLEVGSLVRIPQGSFRRGPTPTEKGGTRLAGWGESPVRLYLCSPQTEREVNTTKFHPTALRPAVCLAAYSIWGHEDKENTIFGWVL